MSKKASSIFSQWGKRINWNKRVRAVCKPCWELRYCPYGPLVEDFPLREDRDSRSCRIFGHDCPVFHVAEPFTETKELRNISRKIPRPVQFRVLKRENQICGICGQNVQDGDIHFDHIIPYSKGGSSDENNVRLLCDECNQKRSNRFEAEFLVANSSEHLQEHLDLGFLRVFLDVCFFAHNFRRRVGRFPNPQELAGEFHNGKTTPFEEFLASTLEELGHFFRGERPEEITAQQMKALRKRWGYADGRVHKIQTVASEAGEEIRTMVILERALLARAGVYLKEDKFTRRKWEGL